VHQGARKRKKGDKKRGTKRDLFKIPYKHQSQGLGTKKSKTKSAPETTDKNQAKIFMRMMRTHRKSSCVFIFQHFFIIFFSV